MNSTEFKQLIADREEWFRVTQKNGFDFTPILSGLYSDSSHFVYEILQNAEDAKAKSITFSLFPDKLEIIHDGAPFTFKDVESITSIGRSTKVEDITAIGKFGVGFKSVYAITQSPTIRSGGFNFTIKNFVVPTINTDGQSQDSTSIVLPFDHQSKTSAETHTLVKNRLENLGLLTLLFLKHITKVVWNESERIGQYERFAETKYKGFDNVRRVSLVSSTSTEQYLVFERPITISEKGLRVEIAYKLSLGEGNKEKIIHSTTSKLFVFLPTNEETYLKFLTQGPFRTTPARDNIPFEDENNRYLIQEIATLVADSLPIVRELALLDVSFLNILPLKELTVSKQDIYNAVSTAIVQSFKSAEPLIPTHRTTNCTASTALLARGKDLTQLLDSSDTSQLFKRTEWIHSDITADRTPEIRDFFLNKLGIPEIDFETFGRNLSANFLKRKDVSWFKEFYKLLKDQKSLWRVGSTLQQAGVIRIKPFIQLEDGDQIAPFDDTGNPQVYLPATSKRKTHFKTVHSEIVADEEALSFLQELGLREPDLFAEISEYVIPKYEERQVTPASTEYFEDFINLIIGYQEIRSDKKGKFLDSLKNLPFVLCARLGSTENLLTSPSNAYFPTPEIHEYFSCFNEAVFVADELYTKFDKAELDQFLTELGVVALPRRIELNGRLSWDEKRKLYNQIGHTRDIYDHDYEIHGLDNFLSNVSKHRSTLLWDLLLKHIQKFGWRTEEFFKGEYKWYYRIDRTASFEAKLTQQLKLTPWLFDRSSVAKKPSSISVSDLLPDYDRQSSASQVLIHQLQFKPDIQQQLLQQLPEDDRRKFEVLLGLSYEELEQMASLVKDMSKSPKPEGSRSEEPVQETTTGDWAPDITPEEADISKHPFELAEHDVPTPDESSHADDTDSPKDGNETNDKPESEQKIPSRSIGRWGEQYVFRALLQDYDFKGILVTTESGATIATIERQTIEIVWLNIKKDRGRGCDFIIKVDGVESSYIEVKSTSQNEHQLFPITGTQWEFARKLFNNGQGEKYWIYRVFNAGKKDCRIETIQNPIEMWKEGKLFAHPINLEL